MRLRRSRLTQKLKLIRGVGNKVAGVEGKVCSAHGADRHSALQHTVDVHLDHLIVDRYAKYSAG
jgi:fatty acid/phospholipid biosynthesis enzyme